MSMNPSSQKLPITDWDIIKALGIKKLPVNPVNLAMELDIQIHTYRALADKRAVTAAYLCKQFSPDGFTLYNKGRYTIYYNDEVENKGRHRWTLIHELCHILRGHVGEENPIMMRNHIANSQEDAEATA